MNGRFLIFRTVVWAQVVLLLLMVLAGSVYALALALNSSELSLTVYPFGSLMANILRYAFYVFLGGGIAYNVYRHGRRSKTPIDPGLFDRLRQIVSQTQAWMMIAKPVKLLIQRKSSNAFNPGRNRIIVGEKLAREMNDQELTGLVGHELAHGIMHHVWLKTILVPVGFAFAIVISIFTQSWAGGRILFWTFFALVSFAQIPLFWKLEYGADGKAAELLGGETMISALAKLRTIHFDGITFTHPPLSSRIRRISEHQGGYGLPKIASTTIVSAQPMQSSGRARPVSVLFPQTSHTYEVGVVLEPGETLLWNGRSAFHLRYPILTVIFFLGIFILLLGPHWGGLGVFSALFFLIFWITTIVSLIIDRTAKYSVTNLRIVARKKSLPIRDVLGIRVTKSFLDRLRGTGRICFDSRDGVIAFKHVKDPERVKQGVMNLRATLPDVAASPGIQSLDTASSSSAVLPQYVCTTAPRRPDLGTVLETGEMVVWRGRSSFHLRYPILAVISFFVNALVFNLGPLGEAVGLIFFTVFIVSSLMMIITLINDKTAKYFVTNRRIVARKNSLPTQDLVGARVKTSRLDRLRGTGTIYFDSRDGRWVLFQHVKDPEQIQKGAMNARATSPIPSTVTTVMCKHCGARVAVGMTKCPVCGAAI